MEKMLFETGQMDSVLFPYCSGMSIFEYYRVVDPDTHLIYDYQDGCLVNTGEICYAIWKRDTPCRNCISRQVCRDGQQMMKMEYLEDQVMLILSVPIILEGRPYALELVKDVTRSMTFYNVKTNEHTGIMQAILTMNEAVNRDAFTGLYNKLFITEQLSKEIGWALETGSSLTAAVMDIDHFKEVNDRYGHMAGDRVLKGIVECIRAAMADRDGWAGRMGGDEFFLLFRDMEEPEAEDLCRRLSDRIAARQMEYGEERFRVTVSIGVRAFDPKVHTPEGYLNSIDQAMYGKKRERSGRVAHQ